MFNKVSIFITYLLYVSYMLFPVTSLSAMSDPQKTQNSADYPLIPIEFHEVVLQDDFWLPRLKIQREVLLPHAFKETKVGVEHLRAAARFHAGFDVSNHQAHPFIDSDLYKVMEGAAYLLKLREDPQLEARMDGIIRIIKDAQREDGYLYPSHITGAAAKINSGMGKRPYSYVEHSHELYNMGHLYEAAIAYYQATGKDELLKIAEKNAQHINKVFFEGDRNYNNGVPVNQAPGHEEIELALVKLYRLTDNKLYFEMAQRFLDIRGVTYLPNGRGTTAPEYGQQHLPVREQSEAVGHAVRATYLYAAMADVGAISGNKDYSLALDRIWNNIVNTRMHITGGLGAVHGIEGFGPQYDLPNAEAFDETCAAVGNVLVNYRMFLLHKDAKYLDVAEVALYNNVLAGVSLKGDTFFYLNPLAADGFKGFNHGHKTRASWFGTACCPSNLARLVPQLTGMMYATDKDNLYLSLYAGNKTTISLNNTEVELQQSTKYPLDGNIKLQVSPSTAVQFNLHMRIPTWTGNKQFVPGKLYSYIDESYEPVEISVNNQRVNYQIENGFAVISRQWNVGDVVEMNLPMIVRANVTIEKVEANHDRVAFTRGPLVMCAESIDNQEGTINRFVFNNLSSDIKGESKIKQIVNGHSTVFVDMSCTELIDEQGNSKESQIQMIPYYAWNNRGVGSMSVWMPRNKSLATIIDNPMGKDSLFKNVLASHTFELDSDWAVGDRIMPSHSDDHSIPRWTSWPQRSTPQWLVCELKKPSNIRSIAVYWYDDRPSGGECAVPESWSLEVYADGKWKPFDLYLTDSYGTQTSQFNVVHPAAPLTCSKFRILMNAQRDLGMGILEVDVEFEGD
ncbi:glycoside hydrolase family 127 protein [Planctomycetota bacterium]|nr:glycoside hydrolase family 127 protein [Planctomycetota bacterium]